MAENVDTCGEKSADQLCKFGRMHWLIAGMVMGMIPMVHVGIKSGQVRAPGLWMTHSGGMLAFAGGLLGHLVFGLVVVLVYNLF